MEAAQKRLAALRQAASGLSDAKTAPSVAGAAFDNLRRGQDAQPWVVAERKSPSPAPAGRAFLGLNIAPKPEFRILSDGRLKVQVVDPQGPGLGILNWAASFFMALLSIPLRRLLRDVAVARKRLGDDARAVQEGFKVRAVSSGLENLPAEGPILVVANHPLAGLDGVALVNELRRRRPDVKVVVRRAVQDFLGLEQAGIPVEMRGVQDARELNRQAIEKGLAWLRDGHVLLIFPSGAVSSLPDPGSPWPQDGAWQKGAAIFARGSGAPVLPVHIEGGSSALFRALARIWRPLTELLMLYELSRLEGAGVRLRAGALLPPEELASFPDDSSLLAYLRGRVYGLRGA